MQAILKSSVDFQREPWPKISANAKDLVQRMLDPDPSTRLTAKQVLGMNFFLLFISDKILLGITLHRLKTLHGTVLAFVRIEHPWLQNANMAPNISLGETVRTRLQQFSVMNRFKKKALRVSGLVVIVLFVFFSFSEKALTIFHMKLHRL